MNTVRKQHLSGWGRRVAAFAWIGSIIIGGAAWAQGATGFTATRLSAVPTPGGPVSAVAFGHNGRFAWIGNGGEVRVYATGGGSWSQVWRQSGNGEQATGGLAFSSDGTLLVIGGYGSQNRLGVVDIDNKRLTLAGDGHRAAIMDVAISPDGQLVASASQDRTIRIWNLWSVTNPAQTLTTHSNYVNAVAFAGNDLLVSGSDDRTVRIWRRSGNTFSPVQTLTGHRGAIYSVAVSPDNAWIASAAADGVILVYRLENGQARQTHRLTQFGSTWVRGVAFSSDSRYLAAVGDKPTAYVWSMAGGKGPVGAPATVDISGSGMGIIHVNYDVAFSTDGQYLATGGTKASLCLFQTGGVLASGSSIYNSLMSLGDKPAKSGDNTGNTGSGSSNRLQDLLSLTPKQPNTTPPATGSDRTAPVITIASPGGATGGTLTVTGKHVELSGTVTDANGVFEFRINDEEVPLTADGKFVRSVPLGFGRNTITLVAVDTRKNRGTRTLTVTRQPEADDLDTRIPVAARGRADAVAVVIGNREYRNKDVPPVQFAERDARLMKRYLVKAFGFREENVIYMENAGKTDFERIFGTASDHRGQLFNFIKPERSDIFIYYSGHGAPGSQAKKNYLVPVDADPNFLHLNGYPVDLLYQNLAKLPARSVTVTLDACFSGGSQGGALVQNASPVYMSVENPVVAKGDALIFAAAQANQISSWYTEKRHGLFTYFFLKGIQGAADTDKNRQITAEELEFYLLENVAYLARRLHSREQVPQILGPDKDRVIVAY